MNAVGLAVFAVGVIQPIYNGAFSTGLALRVAVSAAIAYSVHWLAGLSLGKLED